MTRGRWQRRPSVRPTVVANDMKIAVVESDPGRAREIIDALKEDGWQDVVVLGDVIGLARKLSALNPDLVLIDLANPSRDALEQISSASDAQTGPVATFVHHSDDDMTQSAVHPGLLACVVDTL